MRIGILGPVEVRADDGAVIDVPGSRLRAVLVALALTPGRPVSRTVLIDWVWGERPPVDAANALQRLISRLRKVLPAGSIDGLAGGYRLSIDPDAVDAARFDRLVGGSRQQSGRERVRLLREALELWRGAAIQGVDLPDSAALATAATRLDERRMVALQERFEAELDLGMGDASIRELAEVVRANPLREGLAVALIRALGAVGRDSEALVVFERTRDAVADALGADPSAETAAAHVALLQGKLLRDEPAAPPRPGTIRAELTSFVGRDVDVPAVRRLLGEHRLVTVVGAGGSGKTRLVTETAQTTIGDAPDGVWFVELAATGTDGDVARAVLTGLGLRDALLGSEPDAEPTDGLIAAIRDRAALLILDNCEHVIDQVAVVAHRLLGACPRLRILATSREPLGITGEALWQVEPLAVTATGTEVAPAVRLLRDRARAVRGDVGGDTVGADDPTVATMSRVCRALDGMPLAIELAAARLRTMSLDQLADRLDDRFRLLTGGSRTALPRHRTLRAVIDWSWDLLTDAERAVLSRLSVFAGGAGLDAAERVCAGVEVPSDQVLELLMSLAEKSLVIADRGRVPRYRMLTTIREYATDRLAEAGQTAAARREHLAFVTDLVGTAEPHLRRADQLEWLAVLGAEHDNITAAMHRAIADGAAEPAMRLAAGAGWYWWLGGRRSEGLDLLVAAAELPGDVPDELRAVTAGLVALFVTSGLGDHHEGERWIRQAHRLREQIDGPNPLLDLVVPLVRMFTAPGEVVSAYEELLDSVDPWVRALARWQTVKMRTITGDVGPDVEADLERSLAEFESLGERFGISLVLSELANHRALRGDLTGAGACFDRAIAVVAEVGATEDVIELRTQQAVLLWLGGDHAGSAAAVAAAERGADTVTWPYAVAGLALTKAELARLRGEIDTAHEELGRARALLGDIAHRPHIRVRIHDLLGYLAADLDDARRHRGLAWSSAAEAGVAPLIARALVGVAELALRSDRAEQAVWLLVAADRVRGLPDQSHPDVARIERDVRRRLGDDGFAQATVAGSQVDVADLVAATVAR